jgi:4-hydroxybenzoyl-CoA reductase subunit beta
VSILVSLKGLPDLNYIEKDNGALRIGALTPLKKVYSHPFVAEKLSALALAASSVGSYHHQTMGTIGGNLCQQTRCKYFNQSEWWRSTRPLCFKAGGEVCHVVNQKGVCFSTYCGDVAPALLVLKAEAVIFGKSGARRVPLENIYSGEGKAPLTLERGEIMTAIVIPDDAADGFSTYRKFANRQSSDFPVVGAAFFRSNKTGETRIALTGVDRKPVRAGQLEDFLKGNPIGEDAAAEIEDLVAKEARPVKSSLGSPSYKRKLMTLAVKQAIREAGGGI